MSRCIILIGNTVLAQFEADLPPVRTWAGLCYFCDVCAEIWCRVLVEGCKFGPPFYSRCPKHGAGSMLHQFASDWNDRWPEEVWHRELQLLAADPVQWSEALDISGVICPT